jgi:hypothetical protein
VQLLEDEDEALLVGALLIGIEGYASLNQLEDVIHLREREPRVLGFARLSVGVELFGDGADLLFEGIRAVGEGERVEAAGLDVNRVISHRPKRWPLPVPWLDCRSS